MNDNYKLLCNFAFLMSILCVIVVLGQFGIIPGMVNCENECSCCCERC